MSASFAGPDTVPVLLTVYELAQDVGHRLRKNELAARGVQITFKDNDLDYRQYQTPLPFPSQSPLEIAQAGFALFRQHYFWDKPVRALTIRGINLVSVLFVFRQHSIFSCLNVAINRHLVKINAIRCCTARASSVSGR